MLYRSFFVLMGLSLVLLGCPKKEQAPAEDKTQETQAPAPSQEAAPEAPAPAEPEPAAAESGTPESAPSEDSAKPSGDAAAPAPSGDTVSLEQLTQDFSKVMCKKLPTCDSKAPTGEQCQAIFKMAIDRQAKANPDKVKVTQSQLDACLKVIETGECSVITGKEPPEACAFLGD